MNKKEKIEEEILKTLELFNTAGELPPNPYFYTRLQTRINEKNSKKSFLPAILSPAFVLLIIVLNVSTALLYLNSDDSQTHSKNKSLSEILKSDLQIGSNQNNILFIE